MVQAYDAVVVGARVAGASTAMLLARQGMRVLLVDRHRYGADTLSTHALMRGSVFLLSRWGLLDRIVAAGTPPIRRTRFDYGPESVAVAVKPTPGVEALYAPRRTVLDPILVDAALAAGAEVRFGVDVRGLIRDGSGRVTGIHGRDRTGAPVTVPAPLTVGADGVRSTVAREAGATTRRTGTGTGTVIYGYWSGLQAEGYEWFYRRGATAGLIPTNGDEVCVFAGTPVRPRTTDRDTYHRLLAAATDGAGGRLARARPPRRLHTWPGRPSFLRDTHGPGWALVGDAGSFLDPLSTHGITDALRDAHLLARALAGTGSLDGFGHERDRIVDPLFDAVERIAGYAWDLARIREHLLALNAAMNAELDHITAAAVG
jgi:flavin-dependent dehydrogenase